MTNNNLTPAEQKKKNQDVLNTSTGTTFMMLSMVWFILGLTNENPTVYLIIAGSFIVIGTSLTPWNAIFDYIYKPEKNGDSTSEDTATKS